MYLYIRGIFLVSFYVNFLSLHTPANNHAIPLLSFMVQRSIHDLLPEQKLMPR